MHRRSKFASILKPCLAVALLCGHLIVDASWAGQSSPELSAGARTYVLRSKSARSFVLKRKRRARGPHIYLPIGPAYTYYDYPYYYSRGYYPRHIVHYVYYPYDYRPRRHHRSSRARRAHRN